MDTGHLENSNFSLKKDVLADSSLVMLRTGGFKASWQRLVLDEAGIDCIVLPAEWDEDLNGGRKGSLKRAVFKAAGSLENQNVAEGISLATDVMLYSKDGSLGKPDWINKEEAELELKKRLHDGGTYKVVTGSAVYDTDTKTGFSHSSIHEITLRSVDEEEIELYLYGLQGKHGDYPEHIRYVFDKLVDMYGLEGQDYKKLARGCTLEELNKVNGGLYWVRPILQHHISSVDKVNWNEDKFPEKLQTLFWSLLGAPSDLPEIVKKGQMLANYISEQGSIYEDVPGSWAHLISLKDGSSALVTKVTVDDCLEIAEMAKDNFNNASNYSYLSQELRSAYVEANNPDGVWQTSSDRDNIVAVVARSVDSHGRLGEVVGYRVVRKGTHLLDGEPVAEGKRLHVRRDYAGSGLGQALMDYSEQIAAETHDRIVVNASGSSSSYFSSIGFSPVAGVHENGQFKSSGQTVPIVYLEKGLV